jgi:inorganic pyrophosphatase
MMEHRYSIGDSAPDIVNVVIEIPQTTGMSGKVEVDLFDGRIVEVGDIHPPVPTYWHYGAIPQTLGDEGEALDVVVLMGDPSVRAGDEVRVRPIGVLRTIDGWETKDDKIIAVPDGEECRNINEIEDLPLLETVDGGKMPFRRVMEAFLAQYRAEDGVIHDGWGNSRTARQIVMLGMDKYRHAPLARDRRCAHVFPIYQHIFIPPPPKHYGRTHYLEDVEQVRRLYEKEKYDKDYGYIISGAELKKVLRDAGYNIGRSRLRGHNREKLIAERLWMADLLTGYGVKVFTASNDAEWLRRVREHGVIAARVDHEDYEVENVAGISALDLWTIQYQRADGTHVAIVEPGVDKGALKDRLARMGLGGMHEDCLVFNVPDRLIPWEVPARGGKRITQLSNWVDYGFNIWPDKQNRPHLVIGEAVRRIADAQGRRQELADFIRGCEREFEGVHFLKLAEGVIYGAPTNSIDVGTAIISNGSLSEESRREMEAVLQRPVDNSIHLEENVPGLRCALFPIDKSAYSLLLEGDPLHHASVDRSCIDPLDPMDAFFDLRGPEHMILAARVKERREALGEASCIQNAVTVKRRRSPVKVTNGAVPRPGVAIDPDPAGKDPAGKDRGRRDDQIR